MKYLLISFDCSPSVSDTKLIVLGPEQTKVTEQRQVVTCILCQEEQEVKVDNRAMVLAAFVQRSTVMSKNRSKVIPDPGESSSYYHTTLPTVTQKDSSVGVPDFNCTRLSKVQCWL